MRLGSLITVIVLLGLGFLYANSVVIFDAPKTWLYHHQTLLATVGAVFGGLVLIWRTTSDRAKALTDARERKLGNAASIMAELEYNLARFDTIVSYPGDIYQIAQDRNGSSLIKRHVYEDDLFLKFQDEIGEFGPRVAKLTVEAYYDMKELSQTLFDCSKRILEEWEDENAEETWSDYLVRSYTGLCVNTAKAIVALAAYCECEASTMAIDWSKRREMPRPDQPANTHTTELNK